MKHTSETSLTATADPSLDMHAVIREHRGKGCGETQRKLATTVVALRHTLRELQRDIRSLQEALNRAGS